MILDYIVIMVTSDDGYLGTDGHAERDSRIHVSSAVVTKSPRHRDHDEAHAERGLYGTPEPMRFPG